MAGFDGDLRKEVLRHMSAVKEEHRDADTGILDTLGQAIHALQQYREDDPDRYDVYCEEARVYTAITFQEKDAQSKRASAAKKIDQMATTIREDDFDADDLESWAIPAPHELDIDVHVPGGSNGMPQQRLGDMTVEEVLALAEYHKKREDSARRWKIYFRRVAFVARYWKKRKQLGDDATLWQIFGIEPATESA